MNTNSFPAQLLFFPPPSNSHYVICVCVTFKRCKADSKTVHLTMIWHSSLLNVSCRVGINGSRWCKDWLLVRNSMVFEIWS